MGAEKRTGPKKQGDPDPHRRRRQGKRGRTRKEKTRRVAQKRRQSKMTYKGERENATGGEGEKINPRTKKKRTDKEERRGTLRRSKVMSVT